MIAGGSSKEVLENKPEKVRKICALVVDDDPLTRGIHGMLLAKCGLETQAAKNGKEAVDLFLCGKMFDLVLMDLEMPVMDGTEATRMLRGMGVSCMIVGVTACTLGAAKEAFMEAGLDFCLEKPLNASAVISVFNKLDKKSL